MVYKKNSLKPATLLVPLFLFILPDSLTTDELIAKRGYGAALGEKQLLPSSAVELQIVNTTSV